MSNHNMELHHLVRAIRSSWGTRLAHRNPIFEVNERVTPPHMEEEVKHPDFLQVSIFSGPAERHHVTDTETVHRFAYWAPAIIALKM